jgi:hypothetical protein
VLDADQSAALRDELLAEVAGLASTEAARSYSSRQKPPQRVRCQLRRACILTEKSPTFHLLPKTSLQ